MSGTGLRFATMLFVVGAGLAVQAQDKSARGTVSAVAGDSITVKVADRELKFLVDSKTVLTAIGAGSADRKAEVAGKPGLRVADFVKAGDPVEVTYQETGSTMRASNIRRVSSAGSGGGSMSGEPGEQANGTVESISGSTLVISGSAGSGGSFKQSFSVDAKTQVVAAGAGTASRGGKIALADFVGVGDQVTVRYRKAGTGLHADEVRVRSKAKK